MHKRFKKLFYVFLFSQPPIARLRQWRNIISILLIMSIPYPALAADNKSNDFILKTELADSAGNETAIHLKPITIIGIDSNQATQSNTSILKGRLLHLQRSDTLGRTLEKELGVSNASFGPGVGIPVIRGLTGSRIRMLQSGIGSHDAASLSPDHAVAIDPLFAEEITIIRGPETVRYGGNAIGGVVDVKDHRIPERVPKNLVSGSVESRYDTNGN
ncbi:TonB-dependent receptor plug domain-containing protein [Nitrosomonas sp.]|uniref:TonB-dependent receptor plug domain-containing protein n=1 Tax=Nitrosomonas sp. TaxID=42353 RepID=UPI002606100F|nr:TonB-dependent receptor plug domain-containing protein [Nitrosomonas sp.]MCW5601505.1 TonB-dependent receptor plug domain-containing protein [Nitrosomonas sp.]